MMLSNQQKHQQQVIVENNSCSSSSTNTTNSPSIPIISPSSESAFDQYRRNSGGGGQHHHHHHYHHHNHRHSSSPPTSSMPIPIVDQLTPDQLQQQTLEQILSSTPSSSNFKLGVHRHRYNGSNNSNSSSSATTAGAPGNLSSTPTASTTSAAPGTTLQQLFPHHSLVRMSTISTVSNSSKRMSTFSGGGSSTVETDLEPMVGYLGDDDDDHDQNDQDNDEDSMSDTAIHNQPSFNELTITCDTLTETDEDDDHIRFIEDDDNTETETESETDTEIELTNKPNNKTKMLFLKLQQQQQQQYQKQLQQQQQQQLQQTSLDLVEEDDETTVEETDDEQEEEEEEENDDKVVVEPTKIIEQQQQKSQNEPIVPKVENSNVLTSTTTTTTTPTKKGSSTQLQQPQQLNNNNSTDDINEEEFLIFQNQFLYDMSHNTSSSAQEVNQQNQQLLEFKQHQQQRRIERERLIRIEEQDKRGELMRIEHELHMTRKREQEERKQQVQLAHIHQLQELHHNGSSSKRHSKLSSTSSIFNSKAVKSTPVFMQSSSTHKKTKSTQSIPSVLLSKHVSSPTNLPSPSSSKLFDPPQSSQHSQMTSPRGGGGSGSSYDVKNSNIVSGSVESASSLSSYHSASSSVRSSPFMASPMVSPRYENSLASSTSSLADPTSVLTSSSVDGGYPISPTGANGTKNALSFSSNSISPPPDHEPSTTTLSSSFHHHNNNNNHSHQHNNSHHNHHHHRRLSKDKDNAGGGGGGKKSQFFTSLFNVKKLSQNLKEGRERDRDKDSNGSNSSRGSNSKDNEECYVQIYRGNGESWRAKVNRLTTVRDVFGMVRATSNTDHEYELYISKPLDNTPPACLSDSGQFFQPPQQQQQQQSPVPISSSLGSNSLANSGGIKQTNRQLHDDEKLLKAQRKWTGPSIFILKTISKPRTSVCSNFSESSEHSQYFTPKSTFGNESSPLPSPWSSPLSPSNLSYMNGGGVESIPSFNLDGNGLETSSLSTSPPPLPPSGLSTSTSIPPSSSSSTTAGGFINGDWKVGERPRGIIQWINPDELELIKKVGAGSFAKVYKGKYMGETVAIKVLKDNSPEQLESFKKEYDSLSMVSSPQLIRFYGACKEKKLKMVMEYCRFGSLNNIMNKKRFELSWPLVFKWMLQAFHGVNCLHNTGLVHRDIKSHNLLINSNFDLKVADLGLTKPADIQTNGNLKGTMAYCAPELYSGEQYKPSCDIYSMGIVLWEIVNRCIMGKYQRPFSDNPEISFDFQIIILTSKQRIRPTMPPSVPAKLEQLIRSCWDQDPSKRPDGKQVIQSLEKLCVDYMTNKQEWDVLIPQQQQSSASLVSQQQQQDSPLHNQNNQNNIEIIP